MQNWQVLILSGPMGSGKASIGQSLCQSIPGTQFVQVYRSRSAPLSLETDSAKDAALATVSNFLEGGSRVIIDDVIESPAVLMGYIKSLEKYPVIAITLMPGLEEMERRDAIKPLEQRAGAKLSEVYQLMAQKLSEHSSVLYTDGETVGDTVKRILAALE